METQNAILRASSHSALPSIQIPSRTRSPKLVSSKFHCSFSSRPSLSKANIQCRTKVGKFVCKGVSDFEEDKPKAKHRRKNLAVFVSGGGSNFRSIHEATLSGSVHGDVVLVTNKHDCGGAEYARNKGLPVIVFPISKDDQDVFSAEDLVIALSWLSQTHSG